MKNNKVLVILNPAARGDRARLLKQRIESLSLRAVIRTTRAAGDAEALAERGVEQGFETIVAAGGDGTVNEVVNGIGESGVPLGILPVGTMNVFAMELGIPPGLEEAWRVIDQGRVREIDLPVCNGEFFVQLGGVGLDAEVVKATTVESKKALGPLSYVLSLAQISAQVPPRLHITAEGVGKREGRFVLVGNGRFYGGPLVLFKDARVDDGLLDVVIFKNQSPWDVVRYVQAIVFGSHPALPDVEYFQTRAIRVEGHESIPYEVDGELSGTLPCEFSFAESKLRVRAPAK
ncbi:MAG TPA: diacylglycerol kinase family protein [Chthoniobacterales bacterium]